MLGSTSAFFIGTIIIDIIYIYIYIYMYIWNILNLQISFLSTLQEFKMLHIYPGGRFLCRSLESVIFCFLVSCSAVYSSFDIQSYFKLVNKFIQQIWVSFLFSSKYDEGIHDNIHSRSVFHYIHGCMVKDAWLPVPGCSHPKIFLKYFQTLDWQFFFRTISQTISFFLFHFQNGSNKT